MGFYGDNLVINNSSKPFNPYNVIAFDTESKRYVKGKKYNYNIADYITDEKLEFFNYDLFDGSNHYYSEDVDKFKKDVKFLLNKHKRITIFAHNLIHDLRTVRILKDIISDNFLGLEKHNLLLDKVIYLKFTAKYNRHIILNFIDSMNYFHTKVENLAEMLGMSKTNVEEYNYEPEEWNKTLEIDGEERVKTDTEILYYAIKYFLDMNYTLGISIASTSFNELKKTLDVKISMPKSFLDVSLDIYRGGINMPYVLIQDKYAYSIDINSLYPTVMKKNLYSYKFKGRLTDYRWLEDNIKNDSYNYFMKVKYYTNDKYNHSPVFTKYDNLLIPFLSAEAWITGREYLYLIYNNFNVMVEEVYEYFNKDLFSNFVDKFYNKRLNAKTEYEKYFYKIILNSAYGKFGQHKAISEIIPFDEIENPMIYEIVKDYTGSRILIDDVFYNIYDEFVSITKEIEPKYNPLIAGEVTANARLINYDYSNLIGFKNLFYTDTDSFTTDRKIDNFVGNELGQVKIEKEGRFTIYGSKDYTYYGKCNKKTCEICDGGKTNGLHYVIKGVNTIPNGSYYKNNKWSKLKFAVADDVYVSGKVQALKRLNKKMFYENGGIGREWYNYKEYNLYKAKEADAPVIKQIDFSRIGDIDE